MHQDGYTILSRESPSGKFSCIFGAILLVPNEAACHEFLCPLLKEILDDLGI
jgi:hypothetical protein